MEKLSFNTSTELDYHFLNTRLLLLDKENNLFLSNLSDLDITLGEDINVHWKAGITHARSNHFNVGIDIPDQIVKGELEIDLDEVPSSCLLAGEGYENFSYKIELKNINYECENKMNIFQDDISPTELSFNVSEIKQISKDEFLVVVEKVKLVF